MEARMPEPFRLEHEGLQAGLLQATRMPGQVGAAAQEVERVLLAHFEKEEEYALPPLGLLPFLAQGQVTPDMASVVAMTDRLKADLPHMLEEHEAIVAALRRLIEAANADHTPEPVRFAEKLMLHARTEKEVSYPTLILIGEYLKLRLHR